MDKNQEHKITILEDGPYIVTGNVPISEKIINPLRDGTYEYKEGRQLPQSETYALCRCGETSTPPFCDGSHLECEFNGRETASGVSGPIYVKGNIKIVSSTGLPYEQRNRVTLCRCGESRNKPFCDTMHVSTSFNDDM